MGGLLKSGFTSLPGSLIHPLFMLCVCAGWVVAWSLGLNVKRSRRARSESDGLLDSGEYNVLRRSSPHPKLASVLLLCTVVGMFCGMGNTFSRTGRLFPGAHLYCAFGLVTVICTNVALAPFLRERPKLRLVHTAVGGFAILLIIAQVYSGVALTVQLINSFL